MMVLDARKMRLLAMLVVVMVMLGISSFVGLQFVRMRFRGAASVTLKESNIQFMAMDRNTTGGYVLRNITYGSTYAYKVELNEWVSATNWSSPGAFAIVNTQSIDIRVTKIEVTGDTDGRLRIYLHNHSRRPCNSAIVAPGLSCETTADMQLYYDGSQSFDFDDYGWQLGAGWGYDATERNLTYTYDGTEGNAVKAKWNSTLNIWVYNDTVGDTSNTGNNDTANFVWVEVNTVVPEGADDNSYSGNIIVYFKAKE